MFNVLALTALTALISGLIVGGVAQAQPKQICARFSNAVKVGSPEARFKSFLDVQWKYAMEIYPEWASSLGHLQGADRWTDQSLAAVNERAEISKCQLASLKSISRNGLKGETRVSYDLALRDLRISVEGQRFDSEVLAANHLEGPHIEIPDQLEAMPRGTVNDYENILGRLDKIDRVLAQTTERMREGLKRKVTPVKIFMERVPGQIDVLLTGTVEESPLYKPFAELSSNRITDDEKGKIRTRAKAILETKVFPALRGFRAFLVKDYIPNCRTEIAWTSVPQGRDWYAHLAQYHTTTPMTPDELHELGLREVARIRAEMEKIREQVGFKGDLRAFNKFLLEDDRFYYSTSEELLAGYREIGKLMDAELPKLFKRLPRLPYGVREMAAYKAPASPTAYYISGSLEAGRAGFFEANTFNLKARPKWGMEALTFHEAVPGHHLQIALAQEIEGLPEFRRHGGHTAFIEGWGLYAESLGRDVGLFKDPYSRYGQLTYEIWRAIRLVLDTGLHSKGWTRDQAIDYFLSLTPKSRLEVEVEVDRYITWPGQALAYKVGELKFQELRKRAERELGDKFDIRAYHDEVLGHGSLPLDVLELRFNEWLSREKTQRAAASKRERSR